MSDIVRSAYLEPSGAIDGAAATWQSAAASLMDSREELLGTQASTEDYPPGRFGRELAAAAALLRENPDLAVITLSLGGWDTHSEQGGANGRQASLLRVLSRGVAAFLSDLGARADSVAVLIQTEFGRTVHENASAGTDHGMASTWMAIGNHFQGGVHLGRSGWPGLEQSGLVDGRFLPPSIDYRDVYADVLLGHMECLPDDIILPDRQGYATGLI
jgi:uncharacterized protein (DUF1501 family)